MKTLSVSQIIKLSLAEDIGRGDVTSNALIASSTKATAQIVAKSQGIVCGLDIARQVFKTLDKNVQFTFLIKDGQAFRKGQVLAKISGKVRTILTGERLALNFLSRLSGIATHTNAFVKAIKLYKTQILDTRKTTPLLRELERYAVRCGGGYNHRYNLEAMVMLKDNHHAVLKNQPLMKRIGLIKNKTKKLIEVEIDRLSDLEEVLLSGVDIILLDNMTPAQIRSALTLRKKHKAKVLLEASGGINLKNIRQYAATGVDRISIGSLTHSSMSLDMSLEIV